MKLEEYLNGRREEKEHWALMVDMLTAENLTHIQVNFEAEGKLPEETWNEVFEPLPILSWTELQAELRRIFRKHTLAGPPITSTPQPKGRALETGRFTAVMKEAGLLTSPDAETQFLNDIRAGHTPSIPHNRQLRTCSLGRFLMWSTFKEAGGDPFVDCSDAAAVRQRLGLMEPIHPEDRELCLMIYEVPSHVDVRYPTIADAYAANAWNPLFQCSNPSDPWGYTSGGHPEVVHTVITGHHLSEPLRIVR